MNVRKPPATKASCLDEEDPQWFVTACVTLEEKARLAAGGRVGQSGIEPAFRFRSALAQGYAIWRPR
jgi:hypothetical protein